MGSTQLLWVIVDQDVHQMTQELSHPGNWFRRKVTHVALAFTDNSDTLVEKKWINESAFSRFFQALSYSNFS